MDFAFLIVDYIQIGKINRQIACYIHNDTMLLKELIFI